MFTLWAREYVCHRWRWGWLLLPVLAVVLLGCASAGAQMNAGTPTGTEASEPPARSGEAITPAPRSSRIPVTGNDQPVSSDQPITPGAKRVRALIVGRVFDASGKPLADASVAVVQGTAPFPDMAYRTDEQGGYRMALPPGRYTLAANKDGYRTVQGEVSVSAAQESTLDLYLPDQ